MIDALPPRDTQSKSCKPDVLKQQNTLYFLRILNPSRKWRDPQRFAKIPYDLGYRNRKYGLYGIGIYLHRVLDESLRLRKIQMVSFRLAW